MDINISKIPESKTIWFLLLGIVLYISSAYINGLYNNGAANGGIIISVLIIVIAILAQIRNWQIYWETKAQ